MDNRPTMIYNGDRLASWEAELFAGDGFFDFKVDVRQPLFIEQDFS